MCAAAADGAFAATGRFRLEKNGVEISEILELKPRNFSPDEMLDRLQRLNFLAVHERKSVTDILGAAGATDAVNVIFRMLRHVVVDDVAYAGNVESACGDIGRDHDFVFAALKTVERFDPLALRTV